MKFFLNNILNTNKNEKNRQEWLRKILSAIPQNSKLLDAGAGELRNKIFCNHLQYISQDICEYNGKGNEKGLQTGNWDTTQIDIISDITAIPEPDDSFDVILCSEVLEHLPDPIAALKEFSRLLKPQGMLILTAPFSSLVHFAPYHYSTGFSRYWYEYHLPKNGFKIKLIEANGNWFSLIYQEILRLPKISKNYGSLTWFLFYPFTIFYKIIFLLQFSVKNQETSELACFGWHCICSKN